MRIFLAAVLMTGILTTAPAAEMGAVAESIRSATNSMREKARLPELARSSELEKAAHGFASFMARTGKYGHHADGSTPSKRTTAAGYDHCLVAENIASQYHSEGFTTTGLAKKFFVGWMASDGHRKNMLDPHATQTGVAIARSPRTGTYYAVQLVARPRSAAIQFVIANLTGKPVYYRIDDEPSVLQPSQVVRQKRCRPPALSIHSVNGKRSATFLPRNDDRLVISQDTNGRFLAKIESKEKLP